MLCEKPLRLYVSGDVYFAGRKNCTLSLTMQVQFQCRLLYYFLIWPSPLMIYLHVVNSFRPIGPRA